MLYKEKEAKPLSTPETEKTTNNRRLGRLVHACDQMIDFKLIEGEDEQWSPSSIMFALVAAQIFEIGPESLICDLAAGGAASSIAIATRTGAQVYAVDSSPVAIDAIEERRLRYSVADRVVPVQMDALQFLEQAHKEQKRFDLVLAEGGICGALGHASILKEIAPIMQNSGILLLSGYAYHGVMRQPATTNRIVAMVPRDVREYYEHGRHSPGGREILDEQTLLATMEEASFSVKWNFRAAQNHWSSYFERMQRMAEQNIDVARQYSSSARRFGIGEAFHNLRGQKYLCYSIVLAQYRGESDPKGEAHERN